MLDHFRNIFLRSLRSFTSVSWGYLLTTDISCRPQFRRFLPSFLCFYAFFKGNIYFFILVFSDPILFCLFLFLYNLLLSILLLCLSLNILNFLLLLLSLSLSVFYFPFLLSSIFLLWFSLFIIFYVLFLLLFSSFIYFLSLPVFYYIPLTLLFIFSRMCVWLYYYPVLFCYSYLSIFVCLFCSFF